MLGVVLFLAVTLALLVIVIAIIAGMRSMCSRAEQLAAWAGELGLAFRVDRDAVPDEPYSTFAVFRPGVRQTRLLTMTGQVDVVIGGQQHSCEILLGDIEDVDEAGDYGVPWWYRIATGPTLRQFSYLLLRLPFDGIPPSRIRHRQGPGGFGVMAGWEILQTEWVKFNRKVQVASRDKRFASGLISKQMMEFIVDRPAPPMTMQGNWICLTDAETMWATTEYREALAWMREFLSLWPEHMVDTMANASQNADLIR
jgi:hypothetical protein